MKSALNVLLNTTPEQIERLKNLQTSFAEVCTSLGPIVQQTRCWNRVALHHLAYRSLRQAFPQMGSQMVCNAIYSVSRTCRLVFQSPASPFNISAHPERPLPLLQFAPSAPVYFDRHTLSLKGDMLSMYTLDGRINFQIALTIRDQERFHREKLREIVLSHTHLGYQLSFSFSADEGDIKSPINTHAELPEYLIVLSSSSASPSLSQPPMELYPKPQSTPLKPEALNTVCSKTS